MERTVPFLNGCIALVAFIVALSLILYMLVAFVAGLYDMVVVLGETIFMSASERQSVFQGLNGDFLYNLAFLVVLMKAHSVLAGYIASREIDVKRVVELIIIATALEVLFNSSAYSDHMQYMLVIMGASFFAIYALRYHARYLIEKMAPVPSFVSTEEEAVVPTPTKAAPKPRAVRTPEVAPAAPVKLAKRAVAKAAPAARRRTVASR